MPIKILDSEMISRIAAGEVIERPASVVKELVENSLDAGSDRITVETSGGGTAMIRVTDNGIGIPSDELETAFQRHATSKITSFDDLYSIGTLGFRGEALPSIAAVSNMEVVTCAAGETSGSFIVLKEGTVAEKGSRGRAQGTTMTVRDLLRNVPARLKFLKTTSTENSHIANIVTQYSLAYPDVGFTLTVDGRTTIRTPGTGNLIDAVAEIYGTETAAGMIELEAPDASSFSGSGVGITGMAGMPSVNRSNRNYMSFFVNRRWITSRTLSYAVEEAYHGLLMQGRHPVSIVNIEIPPDQVDVNIHPTKTEVKFRDDRPVFSAVQKAVRRAVLDQAAVPVIEEVRNDYNRPSYQPPSLFSSPVPRPAYTGNSRQVPAPMPMPGVQPTPLQSLPALRLIGQVSGTYIIAEGPEGLYIIDQHAAHERILFEQIREQSLTKHIEIQGMLEPVTLEISPGQDAVLSICYADLAEFGFTIEPFGDRTYLVRAVPAMLGSKGWSDALMELLEAVANEKGIDWREKMEISMACHGAIKAGQSLSDEEMRELLRQLEATQLPNTCPHGRPTIIRLSSGQLEREFHRTG